MIDFLNNSGYKALARIGSTLSNLIGNPSYGLLFLSAKLNCPRICGLILLRCIKRIPRIRDETKPRLQILVMNKSVFIEDVHAIADHFENAELLLLGRTHLHFIAKAFFNKEVNDNNYHDLLTSADIAAYRNFLGALWPVLKANLHIKCVLSGNFSYFEERELAYVVEADRTPFIVIHKECLKTPGRIEKFEVSYRTNRGPFWGSRILVYNKIEEDLIVRTGIASPDKVKVVGMPRLDLIHRSRKPEAGGAEPKSVLLISFHKDMNFRDLLPGGGNANPVVGGAGRPKLDSVWESVHLAMFELARRNPDVKVVIKTKGNTKDIQWLNELIDRYALDPRPKNLRIVFGGAIRDYLLEATVVCGVHSTALLEALAANKPVIVPAFDETTDSANARHFIDFGEAVLIATSKADLLGRIEAALRTSKPLDREMSDARRALLDHWLGNSDGRASLRAAMEIEQVVRAR